MEILPAGAFPLWAPFIKIGTLILACISNYTHYKVWDEVTHPFSNFNSVTIEEMDK